MKINSVKTSSKTDIINVSLILSAFSLAVCFVFDYLGKTDLSSGWAELSLFFFISAMVIEIVCRFIGGEKV